jgi:hypothetical protein
MIVLFGLIMVAIAKDDLKKGQTVVVVRNDKPN